MVQWNKRALGSDFVSRSELPTKSNAAEKTKMMKIKQATGCATSLLLEELSSWNAFLEDGLKNQAGDKSLFSNTSHMYICKRNPSVFNRLFWFLRNEEVPKKTPTVKKACLNPPHIRTQIGSNLNQSCHTFSMSVYWSWWWYYAFNPSSVYPLGFQQNRICCVINICETFH